MPPKTKRQRQLANARAAKRRKSDGESSNPAEEQAEGSSSNDQESVPGEEQDDVDDDDQMDFDFVAAITAFASEWVESLNWDDLRSLSIFVWNLLLNVLEYQLLTDAAKVIAQVIGRCDRTVRQWRKDFITNNGSFPDSLQGKYQREGVLWQNEELNRLATNYVRENAVTKGKPNLTNGKFCKWVNEVLLPNQVLDPGFPRSVSIETSRKWLHFLGFSMRGHQKGTYVDGHERSDVVEYRQKFLRKMFSIGFLNKENAASSTAQDNFPSDLESPPADQVKKTIVLFHDESTFKANEGQTYYWGTKDMHFMRPKGSGAGIMVSDFIDEYNGYLRLTAEEHTEGLKKIPNLKRQARAFLEYGENKEGYWTSERFLAQIEDSVKIAEVKYPREHGYRLIWIFDHSSCHGAFSPDALNAYHMNAKPGGKQPCMRDTINPLNGQVQKMVFSIGIPKGIVQVLKERGVSTKGMKLDDMRKELASHTDFREEKTKIEHYLNGRGHACIMLPKFHCEFNPIERCWAQAKRYSRAYCNYSIVGLRKVVPDALDSVTHENICNHFRKVRQYMFGYVEGCPAGPELEEYVKKCKKLYTSHRRVGANE